MVDYKNGTYDLEVKVSFKKDKMVNKFNILSLHSHVVKE